MPRILSDPGLLECPDFASPTYAAARVPLINPNVTEELAIQLLKDVWHQEKHLCSQVTLGNLR